MNLLNRKIADIPAALPLKVMQFGGGNFLRAFVDWMFHRLNTETDFNGGVVVIKPTERGDYHTLKSQDGLFTVVLDGINNGALVAEKTLVSCVQKVVNPYTEWQAYLALAKDVNIRFIVSNTTEAGIVFNANDAFDDHPPKEFPAKLTAWLYQRFLHFEGDTSKGCIVLPCELIEDNGAVLKRMVLKYADHWKLGNDFKHWLYAANHFCSTLVDRIVSGYPNDREEEIQQALGYKDQLLVAGEQYHSWVIQSDVSIQEELPFAKTDLNVEFVNDLVAYREMKVRILNGAHTAMVPVGYLAELRLVKEAMDDQLISSFVTDLLKYETQKTLDFSEQVLDKFTNDVLDRFRNPLLKHQLISISLNSTSKFVSRLLPTFKDYYFSEKKVPQRIVFALAALICFYKGTAKGEDIPLKDSPKVLNFFASNWKKVTNNEMQVSILVGLVLSNSAIWGEDLNRYAGLADQLTDNIISIESIGIRETLKKITNDH